MDVHVPFIDITSLRSISCIREKSHFPNLDISFSTEYFPTELIHLAINSIQFKVTTPKKQALGCFTKRNLNRLYTWVEWGIG